jgi:hypothetical protein
MGWFIILYKIIANYDIDIDIETFSSDKGFLVRTGPNDNDVTEIAHVDARSFGRAGTGIDIFGGVDSLSAVEQFSNSGLDVSNLFLNQIPIQTMTVREQGPQSSVDSFANKVLINFLEDPFYMNNTQIYGHPDESGNCKPEPIKALFKDVCLCAFIWNKTFYMASSGITTPIRDLQRRLLALAISKTLATNRDPKIEKAGLLKKATYQFTSQMFEITRILTERGDIPSGEGSELEKQANRIAWDAPHIIDRTKTLLDVHTLTPEMVDEFKLFPTVGIINGNSACCEKDVAYFWAKQEARAIENKDAPLLHAAPDIRVLTFQFRLMEDLTPKKAYNQKSGSYWVSLCHDVDDGKVHDKANAHYLDGYSKVTDGVPYLSDGSKNLKNIHSQTKCACPHCVSIHLPANIMRYAVSQDSGLKTYLDESRKYLNGVVKIYESAQLLSPASKSSSAVIKSPVGVESAKFSGGKSSSGSNTNQPNSCFNFGSPPQSPVKGIVQDPSGLVSQDCTPENDAKLQGAKEKVAVDFDSLCSLKNQGSSMFDSEGDL